jgi:hypothetical protein
MAPPAIYLDECLGRRLAVHLRSIGLDVVTVAEVQASSRNDEAQLVYASSQGRLLLSQNQIDFRRLHAIFRQERRLHAGIILVPQTVPYQRKMHRVRLLIDWVGTFSEHQSRLFTWADLQQQIIHGFRLPGWHEEIVRDAVGWRT